VHQQAHALAPTVIPAPGGATSAGVDQSSDLEPQSPTDRAKLEKLYNQRSTAENLKEKGILKGESGARRAADRDRAAGLYGRYEGSKVLIPGAPGDSLAGKRAELERSMIGVSQMKAERVRQTDSQDKLDKEIAHRPQPEELVKKGILNRKSATFSSEGQC
jgi:hypothetical protein